MEKLKEFYTNNKKVILIAGGVILAYLLYTKMKK